jgi:hypothetical protein
MRYRSGSIGLDGKPKRAQFKCPRCFVRLEEQDCGRHLGECNPALVLGQFVKVG